MLIPIISCLTGCTMGAGVPPMRELARQPAPAVGASYRIPYRLTDTKHILIRARLNGHGPYNFIMDTGAPDLFLASELAREANCTVGADGYAAIKTFQIEGGPTLRGTKARVEELFQLRSMNAIDAAGARIDGVMGYTLLARFKLDIDLRRDYMIWTQLDYTPPRPPVMIELTGGKPLAAAKDAKNMEGLAKVASTMFQRKQSPPAVSRGFLGIEFAPGDGPPVVARVFPGGPAERAGMKSGDQIVAVDMPLREREEIGNLAFLRMVTSELRSGESVTIIFVRAGERFKAVVKAEAGVL